MPEISRREALVLAGACACCSLLADDAPAADRGKSGDRPQGAAPKSVEIGKLTDYAKPGVYDKFRAQRVIVSKLDDRLVVMSAVCTHKGCLVRTKPDDAKSLKCPCHGAVFTDQGTVDSGPARSSLVRYAVKTAKNGIITADLTKPFEEKNWDDAAAFIPIKPTT